MTEDGKTLRADFFRNKQIADNLFGKTRGLEFKNMEGGNLIFEADEHGNAAVFWFHPLNQRWEQIWGRTVKLPPEEIRKAREAEHDKGTSAHDIRGRRK